MIKDNLQLDILQARAKLPPLTKKAIDSVDWRKSIKTLERKYKPEQIKILEEKTELLLSGLIEVDKFPEELGFVLNLSKEKIASVLIELNALVFEKIQKALEKEIEKNVIEPELDPVFSDLPKNTQQAIASSGWKEKTYVVAQKYKLNIEQMGALEELTIKAMRGETPSNQYQNHLSERINMPKETLFNLVQDINEIVLKDILLLIKEQERRSSVDGQEKEDTLVPVPPYQKKEKKQPDSIPVPLKKEKEGTLSDKKTNVLSVDKTKIPVPPNYNKNKFLGTENETDIKHPVVEDKNISDSVSLEEKTVNYHDPYREKI